MKRLFFAMAMSIATFTAMAQTYEFFQMTTVESVVPGGLGRSRMIMTNEKGEIDEIKMENFFSMVGINFGNIRFNDALVGLKMEKLSSDGWELVATNSAAYGHQESTGIFITRYLFKRPKRG